MDNLNELREKYKWPDEKPNLEFDDHGWLHPSTEAMLNKLLNDRQKVIVEIGGWLGLSTRFILEKVKSSTVITIDHWKGSREHHLKGDPHHVRDKLPNLYEQFLANCWEYRGRLIPLKANSDAGLLELSRHDTIPDLIYIDGSHEYYDVSSDILTSYSLFPSAKIIGDDWAHPPIKRAIISFAKSFKFRINTYGNGWELFK